MSTERSGRAGTGIPELDAILNGGFPRDRVYLIEGEPGAGKTTLGLQFLLEGARQGERGVYVTLSETESELRDVARSHGWSLDGITILEVQHAADNSRPEAQYTFFHPAEIELSETTKTLFAAMDRIQPRRAVFDSMSELRLLARDPLRYRRQVLALKQELTQRNCTVLLLDTQVQSGSDGVPLESLAHGVMLLEQLSPEYGGQRRRLRVKKVRGTEFMDGYHDFLIRKGGLVVFPRLIAEVGTRSASRDSVPSGVRALDEMVGGGLERGTSAILLGPSGTGKSTLATQYMCTAADRGHRAVLYAFDEAIETWRNRSEALGLHVGRHLDAGRISTEQVNPAQLSPGEFARKVCAHVDQHDVRVVVIDSLNGFLSAMPEERFLSLHLHELLAFLSQRGVLTLLVMAQHGILGAGLDSPLELSYLADTVFVLRYFEALGRIRQAIAVLKKRSGRHERTIRELQLGTEGIQLGKPVEEFQGVLAGQLVFTGRTGQLMDGRATDR